MADGEKFTGADRRNMLRINAQLVAARWPTEFGSKRPHYECENCKFVHPIAHLFQIDHVKPYTEGGGRNWVSKQSADKIAAGDVAELFKVGQNMQVLCVECNEGKGGGPWVPTGKGMAYTHHEDDLNPEHIYHGPPTVNYLDTKSRH